MLEKYNGKNTYEILVKHKAILDTYNNMNNLSAKEFTDLMEVLFYYRAGCDVVSVEGKYVFCTFMTTKCQRVVFYFQYSKRKPNMSDVEAYKKNELIKYNYKTRSKDLYFWFSNKEFTDEASTRLSKLNIMPFVPFMFKWAFMDAFTTFKKIVDDWNNKCAQEKAKLKSIHKGDDEATDLVKKKKWSWGGTEETEEHEINDLAYIDEDMPWELDMDIFDDLMGD